MSSVDVFTGRPPVRVWPLRHAAPAERCARGGGGRAEGVPGAQRLGHAPGLGDAAVRQERRVAVEDLGDRAQPVVAKVIGERREVLAGRLRITIDVEVSEGEGPEQPAPYRALVIGAVARALVAAVAADVARV